MSYFLSMKIEKRKKDTELICTFDKCVRYDEETVAIFVTFSDFQLKLHAFYHRIRILISRQDRWSLVLWSLPSWKYRFFAVGLVDVRCSQPFSKFFSSRGQNFLEPTAIRARTQYILDRLKPILKLLEITGHTELLSEIQLFAFQRKNLISLTKEANHGRMKNFDRPVFVALSSDSEFWVIQDTTTNVSSIEMRLFIMIIHR